MKVLIIEDEPLAQAELKRLLSKIEKEVEIIDCLDSIEDSVNWFKQDIKVDLIFLDIQLSDGLSFEIFDEITTKTPIIFTTAFDEYAIKAFELNSIDYLLKPIKQEKLFSAIQKFNELKTAYNGDEQNDKIEDLKIFLEKVSVKFKDRFMVKIGDQLKFINTTEVAYFKAEDTLTFLITKEEKRYIIDYKLDQLVTMLNDKHFFRITRSYITNIEAIGKIHKHLNGRLKIKLQPAVNEEIFVSKARSGDFLNWLDR